MVIRTKVATGWSSRFCYLHRFMVALLVVEGFAAFEAWKHEIEMKIDIEAEIELVVNDKIRNLVGVWLRGWQKVTHPNTNPREVA